MPAPFIPRVYAGAITEVPINIGKIQAGAYGWGIMRRMRSAKIIATLGPATSTEEMISALFEAGADVFRLNFSHGNQEDHKRRYEIIRSLETKFQRPIGISDHPLCRSAVRRRVELELSSEGCVVVPRCGEP